MQCLMSRGGQTRRPCCCWKVGGPLGRLGAAPEGQEGANGISIQRQQLLLHQAPALVSSSGCDMPAWALPDYCPDPPLRQSVCVLYCRH